MSSRPNKGGNRPLIKKSAAELQRSSGIKNPQRGMPVSPKLGLQTQRTGLRRRKPQPKDVTNTATDNSGLEKKNRSNRVTSNEAIQLREKQFQLKLKHRREELERIQSKKIADAERNKKREKRRLEAPDDLLKLIAEQKIKTEESKAKQLEAQFRRAESTILLWNKTPDPRNFDASDLIDLMVSATKDTIKLSAADANAIKMYIRSGILASNEHFLESAAVGFLADILNNNHVTLIQFAGQSTPASVKALVQYEQAGGAQGRINGILTRMLIAQNIAQKFGINDTVFGFDDDETRAYKERLLDLPNEVRVLKSVPSLLSDEDLNEFEDVYGMTEEEMIAIENYTSPATNARMQHFFGSVAEGWRVLARAIGKLPSTGDLGLRHATFRVSRYREGLKLEGLKKGTQITHGLQIMAQGQQHFMSTATTYNVHSNEIQVGGAGSLFAISGTSGRFINPFGVFGNLDGGEVLYPPGTLTIYDGTENGEGIIPVHQLVERTGDTPLRNTVLEDFEYTVVNNPLLSVPAPAVVSPKPMLEDYTLSKKAGSIVGLRRRRLFKSEEIDE